jgi:single-strand DNA-binding protein
LRDIATAQLSGNLARDVDLRTLPSGTPVARLRVAATTRRPGKDGEWHDKPNYFTVEVRGGQAAPCARYLRKGSRVFVEAELDWRDWTDDDGRRREAVTLQARTILFEGGRPAGDEPPAATLPDSAARPPAQTAAAPPAGHHDESVSVAATADELPF